MDRDSEKLSSIFFDSVCKISNDYFYLENEEGLSRWSKSAVNDFELPGEYVQDVSPLWRSFVHEEDLEAFDADMDRIRKGQSDYHMVDYRVRKRNGEYIKVGCRGNVVRNIDGKIIWFSGIITRLQEEVDPTTQISNVYEETKDLAETFKNDMARGALMYFCVDNFKRINDLYTYSGGNEVLQKLAVQIMKSIPNSAKLYRMDGVKFAIHLPYGNQTDMRNIYLRITDAAKEVRLYNDVVVSVTYSAGICCYPRDGKTAEILQRNTEYALQSAKQQGKGQLTFFSKELLEEYLRKLRMIEALKKSVKNNFEGFELYYQPIVDPVTRKIIECEALLRWKSEEFTRVSPADFIPVLEETGLIKEVGEWIVKEAISQVKKWEADDLVVNVNVSYKQLKNGEFAEYVLSVLEEYDFEPTRLVVELTESCKAHDLTLLVKTLDKLREKNVGIALDDFGTGYASLGILREVTADWVKIDHKFVAKCNDNWTDRNIVKHIILLAHALDIKVCVEGIENEENFQVASEEKADTLQGYYFSRPIPAAEFGSLLETK